MLKHLRQSNVIRHDSPIMGMCRDVRGTFSATISRNTVKASSTEMPREIFSPASGGRQNTIITSTCRNDININSLPNYIRNDRLGHGHKIIMQVCVEYKTGPKYRLPSDETFLACESYSIVHLITTVSKYNTWVKVIM